MGESLFTIIPVYRGYVCIIFAHVIQSSELDFITSKLLLQEGLTLGNQQYPLLFPPTLALQQFCRGVSYTIMYNHLADKQKN